LRNFAFIGKKKKEIRMKKYLLLALLIFELQNSFSQIPFLGQAVPDSTPVLFNLPVSPGFFAAEKIAISPDGKELYYSELDGYFHLARIKYFHWNNGSWGNPKVLFESFFSPSLSIDGNKMFFQSLTHEHEVWYSEKTSTGWSTPAQFMPGKNLTYSLQETRTGYYYLSSENPKGGMGNWDWAKIKTDGSQALPESLGAVLNTSGKDIDFYIAKDESYILIVRLGNIKISYHNSNGGWSQPQDLLSGWAPWVTDDNAYLFFTDGNDPSNVKIYWVDFKKLIAKKLTH